MKKKKEVNFDVIDTRPFTYASILFGIGLLVLLFCSFEDYKYPWGVVTTVWEFGSRTTCFHPELCFPEDVQLVVKDEGGNYFYYQTTGRLMDTVREFDSSTVIMKDSGGRWRIMPFPEP